MALAVWLRVSQDGLQRVGSSNLSRGRNREAAQLGTLSLPLVGNMSLCRCCIWLNRDELQPSRRRGKPFAFPHSCTAPALPLGLIRLPDSHRAPQGPPPAADLEAGVPAAWLLCPHRLLALRVDGTLPQSRGSVRSQAQEGSHELLRNQNYERGNCKLPQISHTETQACSHKMVLKSKLKVPREIKGCIHRLFSKVLFKGLYFFLK